uniref:MARVEL domain-containing protein n=1 Tax=Strigamia maritima TaxID=126957 RepID=T1JEK9_STRMM
MNGGAYGAGKAGVAFDPITFVQRPQVILRLLSWVFAIIVFGCISSQGYDKNDVCLYNENNGACSFGIGVGVIAFLACVAFLILDYMFDNISSIKTRKHVVLGDMGFSGFWSFLWFVNFCFLADQWRVTPTSEDGYGVNNVQAAIAFSFFSIFTWAGLCYFAFQRYRQGADSAFAPTYEADPAMMPGDAPYSSYPGGPDAGEGYQDPPFGSSEPT